MPLGGTSLANEIEAAKTSLAARLEDEREVAAAQRYATIKHKPPTQQQGRPWRHPPPRWGWPVAKPTEVRTYNA